MPPVDILLERRSFSSDNFQKFVFAFHKCFILQRWTHQDLKTLLLSKLKLTAFPMNPLGFRAFNLLINHADQFCCSRFPLTHVSFYRRLRTLYLTCSVCMRDCMSYFILPVLQILLSNSRLCPGRLMKMECPILFSAPPPPTTLYFARSLLLVKRVA